MDDILIIDSTGSIDLYSNPVEEDSINVDPVEEDPVEEDPVEEDPVEEDPFVIPNALSNVDNDKILNLLEDINENVQKNSSVSSNDISDNYNNSLISVSQNEIMYKNISDYTVQESLSLMIFLSLFVFGLVYIIRKGLYKWT